MTLIAGMSAPIGGILIADMMLSNVVPATTSLVFPTMTIGAEQKSEEKWNYISRLESKLSLLSPYVAIAYAGTTVIGKSMIQYIGKRLPEGPIAPQDLAKHIDRVLNEYTANERHAVDLLCLCASETGFMLLSSEAAERYDRPDLKTRIAAAGSGAEPFLNALGTSTGIKKLQVYRNSRSAHPGDMLSSCLLSFTNFVNGHRWEECVTATPADELFGGWYEMAIGKQVGEKRWIERIEEAAFLNVAIMQENEKLVLRVAPQVFFQSYRNDKLYVVRGHFGRDDIIPLGEGIHVHEIAVHPLIESESVSGKYILFVATQIYLTRILFYEETTPQHATLILPCNDETFAQCNGTEFEVRIPAAVLNKIRESWTQT